MTTNVPQDSNEVLNKLYNQLEILDAHPDYNESCTIIAIVEAIEHIKFMAQRQQGSEPVGLAIKVTRGSDNRLLLTQPDGKYFDVNEAIGRTFYTSPPQANALVAAGMVKAAEMEKFPESFVFLQEVVRHMTLWAEGKVWGSSRNAYDDDTYPEKGDIRRVKRTAAFLLPGLKAAFNDLVEFCRGYEKRASLPSAIPADAEAALREVCMKVAKKVGGHIWGDDVLMNHVNSVLGEGKS
jgi:hypothetical protein